MSQAKTLSWQSYISLIPHAAKTLRNEKKPIKRDCLNTHYLESSMIDDVHRKSFTCEAPKKSQTMKIWGSAKDSDRRLIKFENTWDLVAYRLFTVARGLVKNSLIFDSTTDTDWFKRRTDKELFADFACGSIFGGKRDSPVSLLLEISSQIRCRNARFCLYCPIVVVVVQIWAICFNVSETGFRKFPVSYCV